MTTKPASLRPGDTIAIIFPSSRPFTTYHARLARATNYLSTHLNLHVKTIFTPIPPDASILSAIYHRCTEIHIAFADLTIQAIICAIGGSSANELLRHLDYDLIRRNPKIFVGYSDITLLHHALASQAGLRTFYGPAALRQFGEFPAPLQFTVDHFRHVLFDTFESPVGPVPRSTQWTQEHLDWENGADAQRARHLEASSSWRWLRKGRARGALSGGCLPAIGQLTGTPYLAPLKGTILVLEIPMGEAKRPFPLDLTRTYFTHLDLAGILGEIAGLVLGRPYRYDEVMVAEYESLLLGICGGEYPILAGVDVGHTDPMVTLPLGAMARLDSEEDAFVIEEAAVLRVEDG